MGKKHKTLRKETSETSYISNKQHRRKKFSNSEPSILTIVISMGDIKDKKLQRNS